MPGSLANSKTYLLLDLSFLGHLGWVIVFAEVHEYLCICGLIPHCGLSRIGGSHYFPITSSFSQLVLPPRFDGTLR